MLQSFDLRFEGVNDGCCCCRRTTVSPYVLLTSWARHLLEKQMQKQKVYKQHHSCNCMLEVWKAGGLNKIPAVVGYLPRPKK